MSISAVLPGKLRTLVKWGAAALIVIALTWAAVIYWWRAAGRVVTAGDAALFLVALPCLVLAGMAFLHARLRRRQAASPTAEGIPAAAGANATHNSQPALPILNTWAVAGCAMTADELAEILAQRSKRPQPDALLTNQDGFPVLTGRHDALDTTRAERWLSQATDEPGAAQGWRDAFLRFLALLELLTEQLASDWEVLMDAHERQCTDGCGNEATLRGALSRPASTASLQLHVKFLVPAAFQAHESRLAADYLGTLLRLPAGAGLASDPLPAQEDAAAIELLDQFRRESQNDHRPQAMLLLAADSALCPTVLDAWQSDSRLYDVRCPNGLMAGEGAFAVLCANDAALAVLCAEPACLLAGAALRERERSADTARNRCHSALDAAVSAVFEDTAAAPGQIGSVVCDTDHRSGRVLECIGSMAHHTPHLDAIGDRLAVNETCGHLGAASALAVVSAGVQRARDAGHPVLLLGVSHPTRRAAALLLPVQYG